MEEREYEKKESERISLVQVSKRLSVKVNSACKGKFHMKD